MPFWNSQIIFYLTLLFFSSYNNLTWNKINPLIIPYPSFRGCLGLSGGPWFLQLQWIILLYQEWIQTNSVDDFLFFHSETFGGNQNHFYSSIMVFLIINLTFNFSGRTKRFTTDTIYCNSNIFDVCKRRQYHKHRSSSLVCLFPIQQRTRPDPIVTAW